MDPARAADGANGTADPFSRFWLDLMSKMSGAGFGTTQATGRDEGMERMRRAFFDAWAHHCDEFMRSDMFLEAMKKSMDGALAFKQQVNEFLTRALHENQMPARSDTDSLMLVLRSVEERVLGRIDRLSERIEEIEARLGNEAKGGADSSGSTGPRRTKTPK